MKPLGITVILIIIISVIVGAYIVVSDYPCEDETPIENPDEPDEELGFYSQRLIINYQDGSQSSDLISGYLYHDAKIIDDITYSLFVTPDEKVTMNIQFYNFKYEVLQENELIRSGHVQFSNLYNKQAEGRTLLVQDSFDPFQFINYTYPDGAYSIKIIPSGDIMMDGEQINLPDPFSFTIQMVDERSIDINFG